MAEDDNPTREAYEKGKSRPQLVHPADGAAPRGDESEQFALRRLYIQDQQAIPHRQWIYGTQLIRGFVTLLVAPGGTGKSSLLLAMCMAIATRRPFLGVKVHQQCNAALLNLEDPQDEIDRRVTALAMRYHLSNDDIEGRLFTSPAGRTVTIAGIAKDGFSVIHPHEKQIIERVRDENIGVLAVDPFAESHTLEENSNPAMIEAAGAWRNVARSGNCAVLLAHHVRKGVTDSIEAARGAKALSDSARVGSLLSTMTEAEASDLGIPAEQRRQYVRLDDAKANLAPRAPKAQWFHLKNITLDNADEIYPHGDQVGVIEPWQPKTVWEQVSPDLSNRVLDLIDQGMPGGGRYTNTTRGGGERWVGHLLMTTCDITDGQAKKMIKTWTESGLLYVKKYHDVNQRKDLDGLYVNPTLRS